MPPFLGGGRGSFEEGGTLTVFEGSQKSSAAAAFSGGRRSFSSSSTAFVQVTLPRASPCVKGTALGGAVSLSGRARHICWVGQPCFCWVIACCCCKLVVLLLRAVCSDAVSPTRCACDWAAPMSRMLLQTSKLRS